MNYLPQIKTIESTMTIAIQRKGRLRQPSEKILRTLGISVNSEQIKLIASCDNTGAQVLFLRDDDIPEYVLRGAADFGIVGENVLYEKASPLQVVKKLGFGKCELLIAVPEHSKFKSAINLRGKRIATSYPRLLQTFLDRLGVKVEIIKMEGSVEVAPQLGVADAVCDLVQTGKTLQAHQLRPIVTVMQSQAVLVRSPMNSVNIDL
ncbi:MAG: ATP phosphoribosyltransferase [bacterium]|nr:ATP phosphoribosyltransferase [bacterium]